MYTVNTREIQDRHRRNTEKKPNPVVRRRPIYQEPVVRSILATERLLHRAAFQISAAALSGLPPDDGLEVAFAGRSNAGKSSALNALTNQKQLARVSKTPGRTRLINLFELDHERTLVDLPGYGYARVDADTRAGWDQLLGGYLETRQSLQGIMLIMDCRHPLTDQDRLFMEFCAHAGRPMHVLLSKADKLGHGEAQATLRAVQKELASLPGTLSTQLFSALRKTGLDDTREVLAAWLKVPAEEPQPEVAKKKPRKQGERFRGA